MSDTPNNSTGGCPKCAGHDKCFCSPPLPAGLDFEKALRGPEFDRWIDRDELNRQHLAATTALRQEIDRLTAERDALKKLVEPRQPDGEPTVKLATLLSTASRVTRAESRLASLSAEYAALLKVVREWRVAAAELAIHKTEDEEYWRKHYRLRTAEVNLASYPVEEAK